MSDINIEKPDQPEVLVELKNLRTHFFTDMGVAKSVDGISYSVRKGQTLVLLENLVVESLLLHYPSWG